MVQKQLAARDINDPRVLEAFENVPRHEFVPPRLRDSAYADRPLSIGEGQTISQPYTVAVMTQALGLQGDEKVLEVGTGSGYQAAILACLADEVYTIERLSSLAEEARGRLETLRVDNVRVRVGDGSRGWPEHQPFQGILVTAASNQVPQPLLDQLVVGGKLVIPVGGRWGQDMKRIVRSGEDKFKEESLGRFTFVPLIGDYGWKK